PLSLTLTTSITSSPLSTKDATPILSVVSGVKNSMTAQYFIDTNVLLYAGSGANEDQAKKAVARQVLAQADIGFSAQVMQEFYYAAVRKERLKITHDEAVLILEALNPFPVLPVSRELVLEAVKLTVRYKVSYWDAAIICCGTTAWLRYSIQRRPQSRTGLRRSQGCESIPRRCFGLTYSRPL